MGYSHRNSPPRPLLLVLVKSYWTALAARTPKLALMPLPVLEPL